MKQHLMPLLSRVRTGMRPWKIRERSATFAPQLERFDSSSVVSRGEAKPDMYRRSLGTGPAVNARSRNRNMSDGPRLVELTQLAGAGDRLAAAELATACHAELYEIAMRALRRERRHHTLNATALVNEAFQRLVKQKDVDWKGSTHFLAIAAVTIRRILIDYARKRRSRQQIEEKRQGSLRLTVFNEPVGGSFRESSVDLLALDAALKQLAELNERHARVVELKFFGGLTDKAVAEAIGVSERTVKYDWGFARAWLKKNVKIAQEPA